MPYLQFLITSFKALIPIRCRLSDNKRFNVRQYDFESIYILAKRAPHLSTLLLDSIIPTVDELSQLVSTLFIGFLSLNSVFFKIREHCGSDKTTHKQIAHSTLFVVQNTLMCTMHFMAL
jgi:hypothetical protein